MKRNKIEIRIPQLINEQSFKKLAKNLKTVNKTMSDWEERAENRAYDAVKRHVSQCLHLRLYWTTSRPKWPLIVLSECYLPARREKVLMRLDKKLKRNGYCTEFRASHKGEERLTLVILGLKESK